MLRTYRPEVTNSEDTLSARSIFDRVEELEGERQFHVDELAEAEECVRYHHDGELDEGGEETEHDKYRRCRDELEAWDSDNADELKALKALADEIEQYAGDARNAYLIRESYFEDYVKEYADESGAIPRNASWPANHIDWTAAADEFRADFTEVDFDGVTYLVRN